MVAILTNRLLLNHWKQDHNNTDVRRGTMEGWGWYPPVFLKSERSELTSLGSNPVFLTHNIFPF